jgi:hypothetical protein
VRSTPQLTYRTRFRVHFGARKGSESEANSPVTSALSSSRNGHSGTLSGAFGGTENSPAPNDPKLGRLRCARQGLVRVPESNTKYGGKGGKPRGGPRLDWGQVSVSPQGFPSKKIYPRGVDGGFHPLFTGQLFIVVLGSSWHCTSKTHVGLRRCSGWHAGQAMVSGPDKRQADADSISSRRLS